MILKLAFDCWKEIYVVVYFKFWNGIRNFSKLYLLYQELLKHDFMTNQVVSTWFWHLNVWKSLYMLKRAQTNTLSYFISSAHNWYIPDFLCLFVYKKIILHNWLELFTSHVFKQRLSSSSHGILLKQNETKLASDSFTLSTFVFGKESNL